MIVAIIITMSETSENNRCQCYKKPEALRIPLSLKENSESDREKSEIIYESAFVVPRLIQIDEKCKEYPIVSDVDLHIVFEEMSRIIRGVSDFEVNVLSFWILDMFIEGLSTAQKADMHHDHQKATLLWIAYFFNYILNSQVKLKSLEVRSRMRPSILPFSDRNPTRKQLFRHLKEILFLPKSDFNGENANETSTTDTSGDHDTNGAQKFEAEEDDDVWPGQMLTSKELWKLPLPPILDEESFPGEGDEFSSRNSQRDSFVENLSAATSSTTIDKSLSVEKISELNLAHMKIILDVLYRIFGRLWVYLEIQSAFHSMPSVETIELPFKLHTPKPKAPPKKPGPIIPVKSGKKPTVPEKSPEEIEAEKELHKHDYILPLQDSDQAKALTLELFGSSLNDKKGKGDRK